MIDEEQSPIDARKAAEAHFAELTTFIESSQVYRGYITATKAEIQNTKDSIVANEPNDRRDEIEGLKLRGDLRTLEGQLTFFEDARQTLKNRIEEMLERETQMASKKETQ